MRCQTSERSDDVSPLSNGRLCAGACEKNPRTFAHSVGLFIKIILITLVCLHWRLSLERHQSATDFDPEGVCGGPLFAPPFISASVRNRFEFVELGGDNHMYSNYQGEVPAGTGITGWYNLVPHPIYERTVYMYETIGYIRAPELHL